jgi:glucan biosynthesis protein C
MADDLSESKSNQDRIPTPRLFFVDNLRTFAIILVFLVHIAITYGASGLWYYKEGQLNGSQFYVFLTFTCLCQAFFMGLLFLLAGYFTPVSYDRKGPGQFTLDRLTRLWLPVGVFIFLIDPFIQYALISAGVLPSPTGLPMTTQAFLGLFTNPLNGLGFGPLWFIETLFYFTLIYVIWRLIFKNPSKTRSIPNNLIIALFAISLGAVSFLVRIWLPVGYVLNPFGFQLPFFPQYIAFFIVGVIAFRGNWLMTMPAKTGMLWLRLALILIVVFLALLSFAAVTGTVDMFFGGFNWQTAFYAFWEQAFAVSISLGLIFWFREKLNFQNRFTKMLSDNSYAAYILQAPVLVGLALGLAIIKMPLAIKFLAVAPIGVALCFVTAYLVRKIPKVNQVL